MAEPDSSYWWCAWAQVLCASPAVQLPELLVAFTCSRPVFEYLSKYEKRQ